MHRSADSVKPMRQRAAEIMGGEAEVNEWEIAVLHRMHDAHHGACARVIWNDGDPADGPDDRHLPHGDPSQLEELPGFCSVSVMVDRSSGRAVVTTTYDSPQDMAAAQRRRGRCGTSSSRS